MRKSVQPKQIPPIVLPVLRTAGRLRRSGDLSEEAFRAKVDRLSLEELEPRGLQVLIEQDSEGWIRFSIKERADGVLRELILCADGAEVEHPPGEATVPALEHVEA